MCCQETVVICSLGPALQIQMIQGLTLIDHSRAAGMSTYQYKPSCQINLADKITPHADKAGFPDEDMGAEFFVIVGYVEMRLVLLGVVPGLVRRCASDAVELTKAGSAEACVELLHLL